VRRSHPTSVAGPWPSPAKNALRFLPAKRLDYFCVVVVVITYEAKATTRRALTFVVRILVNDTFAITVWASFGFHVFTY